MTSWRIYTRKPGTSSSKRQPRSLTKSLNSTLPWNLRSKRSPIPPIPAQISSWKARSPLYRLMSLTVSKKKKRKDSRARRRLALAKRLETSRISKSIPEVVNALLSRTSRRRRREKRMLVKTETSCLSTTRNTTVMGRTICRLRRVRPMSIRCICLMDSQSGPSPVLNTLSQKSQLLLTATQQCYWRGKPADIRK